MKKPNVLSLLLLTPILLVSCNSTYPSREQAQTACNEWKDKGKELTYTKQVKREKSYLDGGGYEMVEIKENEWNRFCTEEHVTRQFLGKRVLFNTSTSSGRFTYKVAKNYRY